MDSSTPLGTVSGKRLGPEPGELTPDIAMTNQDGKAVHLNDYRGKTILLTFFYTRCPLPDFCPLMNQNFAKIAKELAQEPTLAGHVQLIGVSIDPEYDTPRILQKYLLMHGYRDTVKAAPWELTTGNPADVCQLAEFFGLTYEANGPEQVVHNLRTGLVDPQGRVRKVYRGNDWTPEEVLQELARDSTE